MESTRQINEATRAIYHKQHSRIVDSESAMKRFLNMIQEDYFGLPEGYFGQARLLDAGCGDTAKFLIRMHDFGCRDLTGVDLGTDFIQVAERNLERHGVPKETVRLMSASVDDLPFEDESFDFVCCHGVLIHLADFDQIERAFAELARVTRRGGYLYTVHGLHGGLLEAIYPAVREYYRNNEEFRTLIDDLSSEDFRAELAFVNRELEARGDGGLDVGALAALFDVDFCVTLQNLIQAPVRNQISPRFVEGQYAKHGFGNLRQLKRYVHRSNVRKYFAPLHFHREHPLSRILYGSGNLEYIAEKK